MEATRQTVLSEKELFHIVLQDLKTYDFEIKDSALKPIGDAVGFRGEHKILEVTVNLLGSHKPLKKLTYFVKKTSDEASPSQKEFVEKSGCFLKEIGLYKTVFTEFSKVLPEDVAKWRSKYYYSKGNDLMVVEDLSASGYYVYPDRTLLDKEHIQVALRSVAAMHASSIILEEKLRQGKLKLDSEAPTSEKVTVWDLYQNLLFEAEAPEDPGHGGHISREVAIKAAVHLVDHLPNFTEREKIIIKAKLPDAIRRVYELVKPSTKYRNVIAHGDLWASNILFKKEKGKVQEAVLIDFQLTRYSPPAQDVVDFLHVVQNRSFREKYQDELLLYYYNNLAQILETQELDAHKVLPWREFLSACDYYEELGCIMPQFFFQPIFLPPEVSKKCSSTPEIFEKFWLVDRNDIVLECFLTDSIYRERISEALTELIQKFVLN